MNPRFATSNATSSSVRRQPLDVTGRGGIISLRTKALIALCDWSDIQGPLEDNDDT